LADIDKDSKTEEPTERRISKSREDGRTAKSQEVNTVVILTIAVVFFAFLGMFFIGNVLNLWREVFGNVAQYELNTSSVIYLFSVVMRQVFVILAPFLFTLALAGVISNYWQNDGWIFSWKPIAPKFSKINPLSGWKKIMGKEGFMNLIKSLGKLALVGTAVYLSLFDEWVKVPHLMTLPIMQTLIFLGEETLALMIKVLFVLAIIAFIDFIYQKHQHKEQLKMTMQEVRDERKDIDGNPIIKQRIKQKQFELFRTRMMGQVPEAEVIITNPTHLSIALRYNREKDHAPMCIAKGAGYVALKIREIAQENDIPVVQDKLLAQTLFKQVSIGDAVPESMYKAVAEILAFVYKLKNKHLVS